MLGNCLVVTVEKTPVNTRTHGGGCRNGGVMIGCCSATRVLHVSMATASSISCTEHLWCLSRYICSVYQRSENRQRPKMYFIGNCVLSCHSPKHVWGLMPDCVWIAFPRHSVFPSGCECFAGRDKRE